MGPTLLLHTPARMGPTVAALRADRREDLAEVGAQVALNLLARPDLREP